MCTTTYLISAQPYLSLQGTQQREGELEAQKALLSTACPPGIWEVVLLHYLPFISPTLAPASLLRTRMLFSMINLKDLQITE